MDIRLLVKLRLEELGLEQKDLAVAARVTESYVSQLLTRKRPPPAPARTDIYEKMGKFLKLPKGQLEKLADLQHKEAVMRNLGDTSSPLLKDVRELILRKSAPGIERLVRPIFEKQPFGELERLVTQTLLNAAKKLAREELDNEDWLHRVARIRGRSFEQIRVSVLEFLDADVFDLSAASCMAFLDPLIESWNIDLTTFGMEIVLNRRLAADRYRKFQFVETESEPDTGEEPGFRGFLRDRSLSAGVSRDELEFLRGLKVKGRHPTPLYYYRELQNLRDPLHFQAAGPVTRQKAEKSPDSGDRKRSVPARKSSR
jgi:transcriptional regulator with XRE-family HTH domain